MVGPVDWQQLAWIVSLMLGAIGITFSAFFVIYRLIVSEGDKSRAGVTALKDEIVDQIAGIERDIESRISTLAMKVSKAQIDQQELARHIAENYVMKDSLKEVLEGNREIRESITALHGRLDDVLKIALTGVAGVPTSRRRSAG